MSKTVTITATVSSDALGDIKAGDRLLVTSLHIRQVDGGYIATYEVKRKKRKPPCITVDWGLEGR